MSGGLITDWISASIVKTISSPFTVAKIRLQCMDELIRLGQLQYKYTGIFNCMSRIIKQQGFTVLWKGNLTNIWLSLFTILANLIIGNYIKNYFKKGEKNKKGFNKFLSLVMSGALAGGASLLFVYPYQVGYTKMVLDINNKFKDSSSARSKIWQQQGVKGLYTGFGLTFIGMLSYRASYFFLYDFMKEIAKNEGILIQFGMSLLVTILAGLIIYPIDLIRQRMIAAAGTQKKYLDSTQCIQTIKKQNGFSGFWRGAGSNVLRGLAGALALVIFDQIKKSFK